MATDYSKLSRELVANAFRTQLTGLTTNVVFTYLTGQGEYNPETGVYEDQTTVTDPIITVAARPSMDEVSTLGVVATNKKLIVPGLFLDGYPEMDTNTTCLINGETWTVCKVKEVPGGSVLLVFIERT
jgi:hypothetical protein